MKLIHKVINRLYDIRFNKALEEIAEYRKIDGWLTDQEAFGLFALANKAKPGSVVVEIGSWKGKSTFCLAKGLRKGKIYAIDPFNAEGEEGSDEIYKQKKGETPLFEQFCNTLKKYTISEKVEPLQGYSKQYVDRFEKIDILFIDGDHSIEGCDFDFTNYAPLVRKGGYIAFHDFDAARKDLGPTWVINNRILTNREFGFYRKHDSLWIAQKL